MDEPTQREPLTPNEWWDDLADETQANIMDASRSVWVKRNGDDVSAVMEIAGMRVRVNLYDRTTTDGTEDEPSALLILEPLDGVSLDGETPGEYYLVPDDR